MRNRHFLSNRGQKAVSGLKPKEKLQSSSFRALNLHLVSELSYRDTTDMLNLVLHRAKDKEEKPSTLENRVKSFGMSLSEAYMSTAGKILKSYGIDTQTGIVTEESSVPLSVRDPNLPPVLSEKDIRSRIMEYNRGRDSMTKLKFGMATSCIEASTGKCCYIRIDDIGVKHQKPSRKGKSKKTGKYVENTVVHIQAEGKQYTITAVGMNKAFKLLVAFLLANRLMENYHLVFFSDGVRSIRDNIEKYFGFRQYTLILDWLHLEKKCGEFISMCIKGKKEEKEGIKKSLINILWTGRVDKAIKFLDAVKIANVKNALILKGLQDYLKRKSPNMTCYALRHELGLSISSSRVEKANDIVVASRQKHNGMAWSATGSGALAVIKAAIVNGELNGWIKNKSISFEMVV